MTYQEMADTIATLIGQRLQARVLVPSATLQGNLNLVRRIDEQAALSSYKICENNLLKIGVRDQRLDAMIGFLAANAFNFWLVSALTLAVLVWRGLL